MPTLPENLHAPGPAVPMKAGAAISQYDCVKLGAADGAVVKTAAANDPGFGFVDRSKATAAGQGIGVISSGIVTARCSAAITAGVDLEATADGEVVTMTPAAGVNQFIVGRALTATAAANELLAVLVTIYKYNDETP